MDDGVHGEDPSSLGGGNFLPERDDLTGPGDRVDTVAGTFYGHRLSVDFRIQANSDVPGLDISSVFIDTPDPHLKTMMFLSGAVKLIPAIIISLSVEKTDAVIRNTRLIPYINGPGGTGFRVRTKPFGYQEPAKDVSRGMVKRSSHVTLKVGQ